MTNSIGAGAAAVRLADAAAIIANGRQALSQKNRRCRYFRSIFMQGILFVCLAIENNIINT